MFNPFDEFLLILRSHVQGPVWIVEFLMFIVSCNPDRLTLWEEPGLGKIQPHYTLLTLLRCLVQCHQMGHRIGNTFGL